jgi:hypothetical protein
MSVNPDSILDSIKKFLGFESEYEAFDVDITMYINASFGSLQQLGVGPDNFSIENNTTLWVGYVSRQDILGMVKMYMFMSVRLAFDPPNTSFAIAAIQNQIEQLAWRINVMAELPEVQSDVGTPGEWWILDGLSDFPTEALPGDFGFDSTTCDVYSNGTATSDASWWDLTSLDDFPDGAIVGEFGFNSSTGQVWRKIA